jgi:hypothetical protein
MDIGIVKLGMVAAQVEQLYCCGNEYFRNLPNNKERFEHKIREFLNYGHVTL